MPEKSEAESLKEAEALKQELIGLFRYIERVRTEIAAIDRPAEEEYQFENMGEQLDAIVKATEEATNTIMEAVEENDAAVSQMKEAITDPEQVAMLDQITNNNISVIQACAFQDITGQRVSKLVKSITYVEDRVNALVNIWGKAELEKVVVEGSDKSDDEKLLHGPQDEDTAISQSDIDALFD